jgi:Putative Actinobacterial Holin-X, holin superfamily III
VRVDRSVLDVLNDIVGNVQDIVRSEIKLAKAEVADDIRDAKSSAVIVGAGLLAIVVGVLFLLLAGMYALTLVLPTWGAALLVAGIAVVTGATLFGVGVKGRRSKGTVMPRTAARIEENLKWAKESIK